MSKCSENKFEQIVLKLVNLATQLKQYDYFCSLTIVSAIQLMLSKNEQYVQEINNFINNGNLELVTPEEMSEEVNFIINEIRNNK